MGLPSPVHPQSLCYLDSRWTEAVVLAVKEQGQAGSAGSRFCLDCGVCPGWLCCQAEQAWRRESRPGVAGVEAEDQTEAGAGAEVDWVWWCGYFWYQLIPRWIRHLKQN